MKNRVINNGAAIGGHQDHAHRAVERIARESYGRLVSYLAAHTYDLTSAEDALSEALLAALTAWPRDGVPQKPEAWLLTTARHRIIDRVRHENVVLASEHTLTLMRSNPGEDPAAAGIPDERLKLLFACAHPKISADMHTPLMLQAILGLDAARIAQAFIVPAATMGQRLVRAKSRIRKAAVPFEIPQKSDLPGRLDAVLEAVYAAFGIGWDDMAGASERGRELAEEAIWLARVLLHLMPDEPEVRGLLALMLHCEARSAARRKSVDGSASQYIPLSEQDPRLWSLPLIEEAEHLLAEAAECRCPGRFQLEAAIQSVHAERAHGRRVEWPAIAAFYSQLLRIHPSLGARTGYAAALGETSGPETGLAALSAIDPQSASAYQPCWAVRAHLLGRLGNTAECRAAYDRAIALAEDPAIRQFLLNKRA